MRTSTWIGATLVLLLVGAGITSGCGDDDDGGGGTPTGGTGGSETGGTGGSETGGTGGSETGGTGGSETGGGGGEGGGCNGTQLTVFNHLAWCDVSVAGMDSSSELEQIVCVPEGEVELSLTANTGFQIGTAPWHETDGDTGDGEQGDVSGDTSTTTVTVSGNGTDCVWVCCEFATGGGCDISNPCQ